MLTRLACSLLVALMLACTPAWADVSRDEAVVAALQVVSGRVLSVDKAQMGKRVAWRVKLVTAGGDEGDTGEAATPRQEVDALT